MGKEGLKEVKPGLWEPEESTTVVKIDKDFGEQVYRELKSDSKEIDQKVKTVISEVRKAVERHAGS